MLSLQCVSGLTGELESKLAAANERAEALETALRTLVYKHPNGFWYSNPTKRLDEIAPLLEVLR